MEERFRDGASLGRLAVSAGPLVAALVPGLLLSSWEDGPIVVLAGDPLRSGDSVEHGHLDGSGLDAP